MPPKNLKFQKTKLNLSSLPLSHLSSWNLELPPLLSVSGLPEPSTWWSKPKTWTSSLTPLSSSRWTNSCKFCLLSISLNLHTQDLKVTHPWLRWLPQSSNYAAHIQLCVTQFMIYSITRMICLRCRLNPIHPWFTIFHWLPISICKEDVQQTTLPSHVSWDHPQPHHPLHCLQTSTWMSVFPGRVPYLPSSEKWLVPHPIAHSPTLLYLHPACLYTPVAWNLLQMFHLKASVSSLCLSYSGCQAPSVISGI